MNDKDYKNALIKVRDGMKIDVLSQFICISLGRNNKLARERFKKGRDNVPDEFRGKYWTGEFEWWNGYGLRGTKSFNEVMKIKVAYLSYLIKEIG